MRPSLLDTDTLCADHFNRIPGLELDRWSQS